MNRNSFYSFWLHNFHIGRKKEHPLQLLATDSHTGNTGGDGGDTAGEVTGEQRPGTGGRGNLDQKTRIMSLGCTQRLHSPQCICPAFKLRHDEKEKQVNRKQTESPQIPSGNNAHNRYAWKAGAEMSGSSKKKVTLSLMKMFLWEQFISGGTNRPWDTAAQISRPSADGYRTTANSWEDTFLK